MIEELYDTEIDILRSRISKLEYENQQLKEQIQKMKICSNCKHGKMNGCDLGSKDYFCNKDKWELA